jgi:hypothetical protein
MNYIVVIKVFNSEEIYYCNTIEEVKQTIEQISSPEEIKKGKVRVFKIESELNLQNLFNQDEGEEEEAKYDLNKLKEHIREIFHPEKTTKTTSKYQRPKPPWITYEKLLKSLTKKGR